jgi:hypothetical protein
MGALGDAIANELIGATTANWRGTALTANLTALTHTAPGTPDYAIQALTVTTPYGFVTADEGHTVLKVIANLQTRVAEIESRIKVTGGVGMIADA